VQLNSLPSLKATQQLSEKEVILPHAMQSPEILCGHKFNTYPLCTYMAVVDV
jgi:hypothetical protein